MTAPFLSAWTVSYTHLVKQFADGGVKYIASSRLEQLQDAKDFGIEKPLMLIRIPMLSEIEDVVRLTELSLNSEMEVLEALNAEAGKQGKKHKVILMADLGDLREGFWDKEEMTEAAVKVEKELEHLELAGVGTNAVAYTHLDVYKRQAYYDGWLFFVFIRQTERFQYNTNPFIYDKQLVRRQVIQL